MGVNNIFRPSRDNILDGEVYYFRFQPNGTSAPVYSTKENRGITITRVDVGKFRLTFDRPFAAQNGGSCNYTKRNSLYTVNMEPAANVGTSTAATVDIFLSLWSASSTSTELSGDDTVATTLAATAADVTLDAATFIEGYVAFHNSAFT